GPPAGSPVTVRVINKCGDTGTKFSSISNILQTGSAEVTIAKVDVALDIGAVDVMDVGEVYAGRDILGPIHASTPDHVARGLSKLDATHSLLAGMTVAHGRIARLSTVNGDIGSADHPLQIQAKYGVPSVNCSTGDEWANIKPRINGGPGTISFIQA